MMTQEKLTILCSGASLGTYIPSLVMANQFNDRGYDTDIVVIDSLLQDKKQDNILKTKFAFHRNFSLALIAQKMHGDIRSSLDENKVADLLASWQQEQRTRFIMVFGLWVPIMELYIDQSGLTDVKVELCSVDSVKSPGWSTYELSNPHFTMSWLINQAENTVPYLLPVTPNKPIPYTERSGRFLIHGGGWGLGDYKNRIPELVTQGFPLDVIVYEAKDLENRLPNNRYFMIDPSWKAWERNLHTGKHQFPPFGEVSSKGHTVFTNNPHYPEVYNLVQNCQAIISKPGGATLLDSISAATPLILLEGYGPHEQKNADLWESLGFGMRYQKWQESHYSLDVLRNLHNNLMQAREKIPNYVEVYHAANH